MDQLKWEKSFREIKYRHERKNPSFSSSLLDEIYRSIDEGDDNGGGGGGFIKQGVEEVIYREKTMKKRQSSNNNRRRNQEKVYGNHGYSSSSETDQSSIYSSSRSSSMNPASINPIRTSFSSEETKKSRALKIYGDLKKVKQPISPASKFASFINSLFSKENSKKPKLSSSVNGDDHHRPVRFYPVGAIVDEDCGHKCLHESDEPGLKSPRDLLKVYENKKIDYEMKDYVDEDDDEASDASSDLFELSSINGGGSMDQRYREELPVYGTTHFLTNSCHC